MKLNQRCFAPAAFALMALAACVGPSDTTAPEPTSSSASAALNQSESDTEIHPICTAVFAGDQWRVLGTGIYRDNATGRECTISSLNVVGGDDFDPENPSAPIAVRVQAITSATGPEGCAPPPGTPVGAVTGHSRWVWAAEASQVEPVCQVVPVVDGGSWESPMRLVGAGSGLAVFETAPDVLPGWAARANPLWWFDFEDVWPHHTQMMLYYPGPTYALGGALPGMILDDPACTITQYPTRGVGLTTCGTPSRNSAGAAIVNRLDYFEYPNFELHGPFATAGILLSGDTFTSAGAIADFVRRFRHTEDPRLPDVEGTDERAAGRRSISVPTSQFERARRLGLRLPPLLSETTSHPAPEPDPSPEPRGKRGPGLGPVLAPGAQATPHERSTRCATPGNAGPARAAANTTTEGPGPDVSANRGPGPGPLRGVEWATSKRRVAS